MAEINDVIQFNGKHKWKGCLGIIDGVKPLSDGTARYLVCVPVPVDTTTYIYASEDEFERIGRSVFEVKE